MALTSLPQRTERTRRLPTALRILQRSSLALFQPRRSPQLRERRSARREEMQARVRRPRLPLRNDQNSSRKASRRKLFRPKAMADHEESLPNSHHRSSLSWTTRRNLEDARLEARADRTPIRYFRKEILPIPANQNSILLLLATEEARRARISPQPGKRRGLTYPQPEPRRRE